MRLGWIGTGIMGRSMCGHLMAKGYSTTIYSRTKSRAQSLLDRGAAWADTPGAVAERSAIDGLHVLQEMGHDHRGKLAMVFLVCDQV